VYGCLPSELKYAKRVERASRRHLFPAAPVSDSTPDTSEDHWLNVTKADAEEEEQKAGGEGGEDGGGEACTMSCLERKLLARFQDHVERHIALEVLLSPAATRPPTYNNTTQTHKHTTRAHAHHTRTLTHTRRYDSTRAHEKRVGVRRGIHLKRDPRVR
jgi:hypothetical protein